MLYSEEAEFKRTTLGEHGKVMLKVFTCPCKICRYRKHGGGKSTGNRLTYCKILYFHCTLIISQFSYIENSLHVNLVYFPGVDILCIDWYVFECHYCHKYVACESLTSSTKPTDRQTNHATQYVATGYYWLCGTLVRTLVFDRQTFQSHARPAADR